jgi:glutaminyl-tRNA synthetase
LITLLFLIQYYVYRRKITSFYRTDYRRKLSKWFSKGATSFSFSTEPNGYLHIGHAKSICLNFGLGLKYNAPVNLRFDDTNPAKEEQEYVDAIKEDLLWLF